MGHIKFSIQQQGYAYKEKTLKVTEASAYSLKIKSQHDFFQLGCVSGFGCIL